MSPASRTTWRAGAVVAAGAWLFILGHVAASSPVLPYAIAYFQPLCFGLILLAGAFVVWHVEPAYTFCAAIVLSPLAGNWQQLGIPGSAAPDRLLLLAGVACVLLRAPGLKSSRRPRVSPIHWLLAIVVLYGLVSAAISGTLTDKASFFRLLEAYGILPFLIFLTAPIAFETRRHRDVLLKAFVGLGLYLGLTVLFETIKLNALVFPRYILDPNYGIHSDRGRGPFVEAVTNGLALYVCAVASMIAWRQWSSPRWRKLARSVAALCFVGAFLSLERSVWLAAAVATLTTMAIVPELRRRIPLILVLGILGVGGALLFIPGLAHRASDRAGDQGPVHDRENLNHAAVAMIETKPLLGFGWTGFVSKSKDYFEQNANFGLGRLADLNLHNVFLTYAVDLGLVGATLWAFALLIGLRGALTTRGPPDLDVWRLGLIATALCTLIVMAFVPPSVFPNLNLWLWIGVVWSGRYVHVPRSHAGFLDGLRLRSTRSAA